MKRTNVVIMLLYFICLVYFVTLSVHATANNTCLPRDKSDIFQQCVPKFRKLSIKVPVDGQVTGLPKNHSCPHKKFGKYCEKTCNCYTSFTCDPITGSCGRHGCGLGWKGDQCNIELICPRGHYGKNCDKCGFCKQRCMNDSCFGVCDGVTGRCPFGCLSWFTGERCDECVGRRYGHYCEKVCGNCFNGEMCHRITGLCGFSGCGPGYLGPRCDLECRHGLWGRNCDQICSRNCLNGEPCSIIDGSCPSGCEKGWKMPKCDSPIDCGNGMYGRKCDKLCGQCFRGNHCSQKDGSCTQGCEAGYYGTRCDQECIKGWYGNNCTSSCGFCLKNQACDRKSGECPKDCEGRYIRPMCTECKLGWFGFYCDRRCGHCKDKLICSNLTGECPLGCAEGFTGHYCTIRTTKL